MSASNPESGVRMIATNPPSNGWTVTAFLVVVVLNCWLLMQGIHELGHVLAAKVTGGTVSRVVWWVTSISRTDVDPNPSPLLVCWGGPLFGSIVPAIAVATVSRIGRRSELAEFFAGFCLIANGAYLSVGSIDRVGSDPRGGTMLKVQVFGRLLAVRLSESDGPRRHLLGRGQFAENQVLISTRVAVSSSN